jgi:hypothetical protein
VAPRGSGRGGREDLRDHEHGGRADGGGRGRGRDRVRLLAEESAERGHRRPRAPSPPPCLRSSCAWASSWTRRPQR